MKSKLITRCYQTLVIGALALALGACGFHLKNATPLPFKNIYTNINLDKEFGAQLKRTIQANSPNTRFASSLDQADVFLKVINENRSKKQLSIDADGRVEEYELHLSFTFEIITPAGDMVMPSRTLTSIREIPYNERIVQAKESEISKTFKDMRASLIDQIMRIISAPEVSESYEEVISHDDDENDNDLVESKTVDE